MNIRERVAGWLRSLATRVDGREYIDAEWHRLNVEMTNRYSRRVESELAELRNASGNKAVEKPVARR